MPKNYVIIKLNFAGLLELDQIDDKNKFQGSLNPCFKADCCEV